MFPRLEQLEAYEDKTLQGVVEQTPLLPHIVAAGRKRLAEWCSLLGRAMHDCSQHSRKQRKNLKTLC
eukprot:12105369-Heterocapsa_arctica.AAC.1